MKQIFLTLLTIFVFFTIANAEDIKKNNNNNNKSNNITEEKKLTNEETMRGFYFSNSLGASYNYLGLALNTYAFYRILLSKSNKILWKNTKLDIGLNNYISPSYERISFFIKIDPIAFYDIKAFAGYDYFYQTNGADPIAGVIGPGMILVDDLDAEYDRAAKRLIDDDKKIKKGGLRVVVNPRLKAAYKSFITLYSLKIDYHNYSGIDYYYDPGTFKIHKGEDKIITHDGKIIYKIKLSGNGGELLTGFNYNHFYVESNPENCSIKLTAMAVYKPNWSFEGKPYFVVLTGTHLSDKYHKGDPYIGILAGIEWKVF